MRYRLSDLSISYHRAPRTWSRTILLLTGLATGTFNAMIDDLTLTIPFVSNELNAAYAADGYARVKHNSIGVVLTTYAHPFMRSVPSSHLARRFGVGELSATNGIAGGRLISDHDQREIDCYDFISFLRNGSRTAHCWCPEHDAAEDQTYVASHPRRRPVSICTTLVIHDETQVV